MSERASEDGKRLKLCPDYIERTRKGGLCEVGSKDFAPAERPSDVSAFCAWLSQKKEGIGQPVCKPFKPFFGRDK